MNELTLLQPIQSKKGEPIWELAKEYPFQGEWSEQAYLALETSHFVEFDNGFMEFLPMPTRNHQRIVLFLYRLIWSFMTQTNLQGELFVAPMPVKLWAGKYREPDLTYLSAKRAEQPGKYPLGADLVIEVVSDSGKDRERDLVEKREEYALAGIPEYWIVDPVKRQITVLTLTGETYAEHGVFGDGQQASSLLLTGLGVEVTAVFAAAEK